MKLSSSFFAKSNPPWRVLFFGTDEFSLHILKALNENMMAGSNKNCVVEKLSVAHPRLKKLSVINKYSDFCNILQYEWPFAYNIKDFDVGVLASFGHLVPGKVISMFPYGIINVHPSLLPQWRGAAPLHHTILGGDSLTGVSIMALEPKHFDRGQLLLQKEMSVPSKATTSSLRDLLGPEGGRMILEALSSLPESLASAQPQDHRLTTYAHKIHQPMSYVDWKHQTRNEINRQYRALHETMELRTDWEGTTLQLLEMVNPAYQPCIPLEEASPPGLPMFSKPDQVLWVRCKDGWVGFKHIIIKKKMSAKSFYNGYLSKKHLQGVAFRSVSNHLFDQKYVEWINNPRPS